VPHTIVIDDLLPLKDNGNGTFSTVFGHLGDDNSMWGVLLEKAFAKYHGNYKHIVGGWPSRAVSTLNGGPWTYADH